MRVKLKSTMVLHSTLVQPNFDQKCKKYTILFPSPSFYLTLYDTVLRISAYKTQKQLCQLEV